MHGNGGLGGRGNGYRRARHAVYYQRAGDGLRNEARELRKRTDLVLKALTGPWGTCLKAAFLIMCVFGIR
jgi:hypothetical protein